MPRPNPSTPMYPMCPVYPARPARPAARSAVAARLGHAALLVAACAGCAASPVAMAGADAAADTACNGSPLLCARRYSDVAFPGTHDSFSTKADHFAAADQTHAVPAQLDDGVRVLHLETFRTGDGDFVCHGLCLIGETPLNEALTDVSAFLDAHPREVVTLLLESNGIPPDDMAGHFNASGAVRYVHPQKKADPWPTLGELIDRGERLVVLADNGGTGDAPYPWYVDRWQYTWETPWETMQPDTFSCALDRGEAGAALYTVDQFLDNPVDDVLPSEKRAELVNHDPFFVERLLGCQREGGQIPNFVLVNFYEIGDLLPAVAVLNGLSSAVDGAVPELADGAAPATDAPITGATADGGGDGG